MFLHLTHGIFSYTISFECMILMIAQKWKCRCLPVAWKPEYESCCEEHNCAFLNVNSTFTNIAGTYSLNLLSYANYVPISLLKWMKQDYSVCADAYLFTGDTITAIGEIWKNNRSLISQSMPYIWFFQLDKCRHFDWIDVVSLVKLWSSDTHIHTSYKWWKNAL